MEWWININNSFDRQTYTQWNSLAPVWRLSSAIHIKISSMLAKLIIIVEIELMRWVPPPSPYPLLSLNDASLLLLIVSPWLSHWQWFSRNIFLSYTKERPPRQKCERFEITRSRKETSTWLFRVNTKVFLLFFSVSFFIIKAEIYIYCEQLFFYASKLCQHPSRETAEEF